MEVKHVEDLLKIENFRFRSLGFCNEVLILIFTVFVHKLLNYFIIPLSISENVKKVGTESAASFSVLVKGEPLVCWAQGRSEMPEINALRLLVVL